MATHLRRQRRRRLLARRWAGWWRRRLTYLDLAFCHLGDAGVGPLFASLAQNTMLRTLTLFGNGISRECARDVIMPAVRANTSLRELKFGQQLIPELVEAEQLVRGRQ